jgi:hypothetical protein
MKKTMLGAATVLALTLAVAPVADANQPVRGEQAFVLNLDPTGNELQCDGHDINWWGTIDIVGDGQGAYGMALYDIGVESVFPGNTWHWEEGFAIWTGLFDVNADGVIDHCEPGDMVLYGTDKGVVNFSAPGFHSTGTVVSASGPFDGWEGRFVFQEGSGTMTELFGTLRLN